MQRYSNYSDYSESDAVEDALTALIRPIEAAILLHADAIDAGESDPRPWEYERHLLAEWEAVSPDWDIDALDELLRDLLREEAQDMVDDNREEGPCCNDFHCPCGNSNNYRG